MRRREAIRALSRPLSQHAAGRPPAHRMAEVSRPRARLVALRARLRAARIRRRRARLLQRPVQVAARRRRRAAPTALPLWFTGSTTPDACEPAFARADRARARSRRPTAAPGSGSRARPATCASRKRSAATFRQGSHRRPRIRRRQPRSAASARQRQLRVDDRRAAATSRCSRSSARRAPMPAPRAAAWVKWRDRLPEADRKYGNATPRLPRGAPAASFGQRLVPRSGRRRRRRRRRRRGACARRCARWRGTTCIAAIDAMPEPQRQESRHGAIGARAR